MVGKIGLAAMVMAFLLAIPVAAADTVYQPGTLIIPMGTTYQDNGVLMAYGLVYSLLKNGVAVDWCILPGKNYGDVDFTATVMDLQTGTTLNGAVYRGGPFVVDSSRSGQALPIVQAWQASHPEVAVHKALYAFTAPTSKQLMDAPTLAIFADGNEDIAFKYLNAAGIPQGNGTAWPGGKDGSGLYTCPGPNCCPDCLNESRVAGASYANHADGALFDGAGIPKYCQFMSMHYKYSTNPTALTSEVVAETRSFLSSKVHFFAECQAVDAFEDNPNGHFLTSNGLLAAGSPGSSVDHFHSDSPFAQADGGYTNPGGSEPSYSLASGSLYFDTGVVMLTKSGSAIGTQDVWMNGYVDNDPGKGKVSYLGGHAYCPSAATPRPRACGTF